MKPEQGLLPGNPRCPYCYNKADGYTSTSDKEAPRTGDVTICLYCAGIGLYEVAEDKTVKVRKPTPDELEDIFTNVPDMHRKVAVVKAAREEHLKKNN
jgi:hypothetical protein